MSSSSSLPGLLNPAHRVARVSPPMTLSSSLFICRMRMGAGEVGGAGWTWRPQHRSLKATRFDLMTKLHLLQSLWTCPICSCSIWSNLPQPLLNKTSINWDAREEANPALGDLYKPGVIVSTAALCGGLVGALRALVSVHVFVLLKQLAGALRQAAYSQHS